jgi:nitroimidazol reductase NimA-like FMN-containing flavoprotein (pyridoxamine 5'-phosphate oxidase superfamily)
MDSGHLTRLSGEECRHLLRGHCIGRVVWSSSEGLQVLPVTYGVSGDLICFRVDPASMLGELANPTAVVFEVDDIDLPTATGWSVVVRGETAAHSADDVTLPVPWAPGHRPLTVAITPLAYSGRAVSADHPRS